MASNGADNEAMTLCLSMLSQECSAEATRDALSTILKMLKNIQQNPDEGKYRTIRKENKVFNSRVWKWESAQQLLYAVGWIDVDDSIVLTEIENLSSAISLLEQTLSESSTETRNVNQEAQMSEKDKILQEERRKQLEKIKKEKEERQKIKEQIKADRRDVNTRETEASKARDLRTDANIKRFEDIGVNLNRGGG